jgi:hypothetical protein
MWDSTVRSGGQRHRSRSDDQVWQPLRQRQRAIQRYGARRQTDGRQRQGSPDVHHPDRVLELARTTVLANRVTDVS